MNVGKLWINKWKKACLYGKFFVTLRVRRAGRALRARMDKIKKIWICEKFFVYLYIQITIYL